MFPQPKVDFDDEDYENENDDYEQYQLIEVKMTETYTWKEEVKKSHASQTVKRILPTGKNYQRMMELYHINCAVEHNPVKEAFSLQFQWLAASPGRDYTLFMHISSTASPGSLPNF